MKLVEENGIKSQNDLEELKKLKKEVYKKGFYEGVMVVGSQKGALVCDAKDPIKKEMIEAGLACAVCDAVLCFAIRLGWAGRQAGRQTGEVIRWEVEECLY